jgi:hypothetical protein
MTIKSSTSNFGHRVRRGIFLSLLFINTDAYSNDACSISVPFNSTITEYTESQHMAAPNAFIKKDIGDNKCFPQSESLFIYADTLCNFNDVIPIVGISAWALKANEKIQYAIFMM